MGGFMGGFPVQDEDVKLLCSMAAGIKVLVTKYSPPHAGAGLAGLWMYLESNLSPTALSGILTYTPQWEQAFINSGLLQDKRMISALDNADPELNRLASGN